MQRLIITPRNQIPLPCQKHFRILWRSCSKSQTGNGNWCSLVVHVRSRGNHSGGRCWWVVFLISIMNHGGLKWRLRFLIFPVCPEGFSQSISIFFLSKINQRFHNVFAYGCPDRGRAFDKSQTKNFSKDYITYAINIDPSPQSDGHFEGNFLQLWKPWNQHISDIRSCTLHTSLWLRWLSDHIITSHNS